MKAVISFIFLSIIIAHCDVALPMKGFSMPEMTLSTILGPYDPLSNSRREIPSTLSLPASRTSSSVTPRPLATSLTDLARTAPTPQPSQLSKEWLAKAFQDASGHRLILLDYDGTLRDFENDRDKAIPSPELLEILRRLSEKPNTSVWLVTGRDSSFMQSHFKDIPKVGIMAAYGAAKKVPGSEEWGNMEFEVENFNEPTRVMEG
ncbi:hypothetical protein CROQUDRAFT_102195 [Cronartium quercuum f. sp. fusiforme G11]|uniref:Trehalose-phosphatase n=1 Tax=Cronartium quercuum f. sp. fusiforme G11 TaxID=708437 RepID=A0A9P6N4W1_9BASI|nr:hypothetical protein CROQUDRAFT_102195 [Cronartium quercuum f. sp. fusiforme G11]